MYFLNCDLVISSSSIKIYFYRIFVYISLKLVNWPSLYFVARSATAVSNIEKDTKRYELAWLNLTSRGDERPMGSWILRTEQRSWIDKVGHGSASQVGNFCVKVIYQYYKHKDFCINNGFDDN